MRNETMKISVVMATARGNYHPLGRTALELKNNIQLFDIILKSLEKQTFTDFEFVIVDALYQTRKDFFKQKTFSFPIKHIEDKPNVWNSKGMWALCSARNQGILHSDGELIVFIDDIFSFGSDWLELFWKYYHEDGLFAMSLSEFYTHQGTKLIRNGKWIRDSRWNFIEHHSEHIQKIGTANIHNLGDWFYVYGGAAVSMDMLLRVNGFDENFDGTKSLEDCDLGRRLASLGCMFVFDKRLKSEGHGMHYPLTVLTYKGPDFKSNISLVQLNTDKNRFIVNYKLLSEEEIQYVREDSPNWGINVVDELFNFWIENQNIFDLRQLREGRIENSGLNT